MKRNEAQIIKLYKQFHGEPPRHRDNIAVPDYKVLMRIGPLTHIAYIADDDGKNYMHKFKLSSRPILTTDGKHLVIIGGRFRFTDRGITDR